ncbi:MAG: hypothetical protein KDI17_05520 [Halioglobus sp.]|nr:hypothetical protein [Halioglobus sp.]
MSRYLCLFAILLFSSPLMAVPIGSNDIVTIDGREWAQPDLFDRLSWLDIRAQCPFSPNASVCSLDSNLNGYDLAGWVWASGDDLKQLFNRYLTVAGYGSDELLDADTDRVHQSPASQDFASLFFEDFRLTSNVNGNRPMVIGWQSTLLGNPPRTSARIVRLDDPNELHSVSAWVNEARLATAFPAPGVGAWFYREKDTVEPIPAPGTHLLILLGLWRLFGNVHCRRAERP